MVLSLQTLVLALVLSADAFAAAVAKGATYPALRFGRSVGIACGFGLLEALAPLIGWLAGERFAHLVAPFDHWIAFAILGVLGLRMALGALKPRAEETAERAGPSFAAVAATALGTSIDATAVGLTLALLTDRILVAIVTIGLVTFAMTLMGLGLGRFAGARLGRVAEAVGGVALVAIGLHVLADHLGG